MPRTSPGRLMRGLAPASGLLCRLVLSCDKPGCDKPGCEKFGRDKFGCEKFGRPLEDRRLGPPIATLGFKFCAFGRATLDATFGREKFGTEFERAKFDTDGRTTLCCLGAATEGAERAVAGAERGLTGTEALAAAFAPARSVAMFAFAGFA